MMATSVSNRSFSWPDLADALGLPRSGSALPACSTCPLCQADTLRVYDDKNHRGVWAKCEACQWSGYGIELAGQAWGMPPGEAAARLAAGLGRPEPSEEDVRGAELPGQKRARVGRFWEAARRHCLDHATPAITALRQRLHCQSDLTPARWLDGPGKLMGSYPCKLVEQVFMPGSLDTRPHKAKLMINKQPERIFKGRDWTEVLVLPRHDRPGRLCAFEFVGREGRRGQDRVFRRVVVAESANAKGRQDGVGELGLFGLEVALEPTPFGPAVVAVSDATVALRLQVRHFTSSTRPLPLVAWADDGLKQYTGPAAWQSLEGRRIVLWSPAIDARLVQQAYHADADLSLPVNQDHYFKPGPPLDVFRRAARGGKPWREVLSAWVTATPAGTVRTLLQQLERRRFDLLAFAEELARPARDRVLEALELQRQGERTVRVGTSLLRERADQWSSTPQAAQKTGQVMPLKVCNVVLRIDTIAARGVPRPICHGRVLHQGKTYPFFNVPYDQIRSKTYEWLDRFMVENGVGLLEVPHHWRKQLYTVACAFANPEIAPEVDLRPARDRRGF